MALKINATKSVIANLVDLVNASNTETGSALTTAQVTFGLPSARVPDANLNNTTTSIKPVVGQGIQGGTLTITYTRLGLDSGVASADLPTAKQFTVAGNDAATETTLLAAIATQLGLVAGQFQIDAGTPLSGVAQGAGAVDIDLVPVANSPLYSTGVTISVTWPNPPEPDISDIVINHDLAGFEAA